MGKRLGSLVLLLCFASLACGALSPAVSSTAAAVSKFAGRYACAGQEFGLVAAAGDLTLSTNGVADFRDYYGHEQTGTWSLGSQANTLLFQGMDLLTATYDPTNKVLLVVLKSDSKITHTAEGHSMECWPATPPATATP